MTWCTHQSSGALPTHAIGCSSLLWPQCGSSSTSETFAPTQRQAAAGSFRAALGPRNSVISITRIAASSCCGLPGRPAARICPNP